jgi:ABC-type glycerol-3-phosphate transport system substrate-binding protein
MRKFILTVAAVGAATLAATMSPAQEPAPSGLVTVWTWPNNDVSIKALLPEFNKQFPDITVEVQAFPQQNAAYINALQRAMLSGTGPDIAGVEIRELALLRDRPQWADLSKPPFEAATLLAEFAPFTAANVKLADGRISLLPKHTGPGGLFYRRDLFAAAGLPTEPAEVEAAFADWNTFLELGKKIAVPNKRWLVSSASEIVEAMLAQSGTTLLDSAGRPQLETAAVKQALTMAKAASDAGLVSPFDGTPEWQGAFSSGQVAAGLYGNWFGGFLKNWLAPEDGGKWAVAAAPAGANGNRAFNNGGDYVGILEASDNKPAAWAFLKWIVSSDVALSAQFAKDDLYPAYGPAALQPWMNQPDAYYGGQVPNAVFAAVQSAMVPAPLDARDPVARTALLGAIQNVVKGGMSVDQALAQATAEVLAKL